jgi:hypothetical protein
MEALDRICSTAVLVTLKISQWTRARIDVTAARSAELAMQSKRAGRYTKFLVPKEAVEGISRAATKAREYHYLSTAAWSDGSRLLPVTRLGDYQTAMLERRGEFGTEVDRFMAHFGDYVEMAREQMGQMFSPNLFPDVGIVRGKYAISFNVTPVPVDDFRVDLPQAERDALVSNARAVAEEMLRDSLRDSYARLLSVAEHVAERLGDTEAVFRDSLVTRSRELVAAIAGLDCFSDPTLQAASHGLLRALDTTPGELRRSDSVRASVARQSQAVADILRQVGAA